VSEAGEPLAWRIERANLNSFPALRQIVADGWLLRFSGGHGRRTANSATPLRHRSDLADALIGSTETMYRRHGQTAIFRVPSMLDPAVDARLAARGYGAEGDSLALHGAVDALAAAPDPAIRLRPRATPACCAAVARMQRQGAEQAVLYRRIVGAVALPAAFAGLTLDGRCVAAAYGTLDDGLLCYESVVTDAAYRRRGLGWRIIAALAAWARDNGAAAACLQVDADNDAAVALYRKFGLGRTVYRYHYRRARAAPGGAEPGLPGARLSAAGL
jgi:N-acetylglutamate synthase